MHWEFPRISRWITTCWTFLKCYREIKLVNYFKSIPLIPFYSFLISRSKFKNSPELYATMPYDDDVVDGGVVVNVGINSNRVEMEKVLHYRKFLDMEHIPSCVLNEDWSYHLYRVRGYDDLMLPMKNYNATLPHSSRSRWFTVFNFSP